MLPRAWRVSSERLASELEARAISRSFPARSFDSVPEGCEAHISEEGYFVEMSGEHGPNYVWSEMRRAASIDGGRVIYRAYPRLDELSRSIGDAEVATRVRRMLAILEGIERGLLACYPRAAKRDQTAPAIEWDDGSSHRRSEGPVVMGNGLFELAAEQRRAITSRTSRLVFEEGLFGRRFELRGAASRLDESLELLLRYIAIASAQQKARLDLAFEHRYNGIHQTRGGSTL
jgi:hypothetical protein